MPIPIARSANSAWHIAWVMVGAGRALGKRPCVRLSGRLKVLGHSILGSWRWVLRCNYRKILVRSLTLLATVVVLRFGMVGFGDRYCSGFGGGLEGFGGSFGFEVSVSHVVIVESGCETVGMFKIFRPGGTHDIADGWRESTGVLLDCLGNGGDLVRTQNTKLLEPSGIGCVVTSDLF